MVYCYSLDKSAERVIVVRIAICDDSSLDREMICELVRSCFAQRRLRPEIVPYESGINLADDIEDGVWYDILFLDIYMTDHLGIDIAHKLRALGYEGQIVFLTASPDFAIDSYDVTAAGYILKPISVDKLNMVLTRIAKNFDEATYPLRQRSKVVRVPLEEILFVESSNTKCILHRQGGEEYTIYKRLDEIESELNDRRFLRCHQSYLVNMDHIRQADKTFVLSSGDEVTIRQRDMKAIRQAYLDYAASSGRRAGS